MDTNLNFKDIPGWGMDADPENEPTYPMKNYTGDDHNRINYERSKFQQPEDIEILMSNERPAITRVFGTSVPPSGLSGMIRRYAFKHSEDRYRHWIPLIIADRINVIEGLVDDFKEGYVPNIFSEKGWKQELKYNPKGVAKNIVVGTLAVVALYALLSKNKKRG
jgi:hypothetical protein